MKRQGMSRRRFITVASVGVAGSCLGVNGTVARAMMGGGGCMGGGAAVVDPPPGGVFRDPPEGVRNSSGVYELTAAEAKVNVNGTIATLLTYNGTLPGPVIRGSRGETLQITLKNGLPRTTAVNLLGHPRYITNLHTHGLHASPKEPADCMMVMLNPGESYRYRYELPFEEPGHLNFYHPHVHGNVAEQYWGGLVGPLVIRDDNTSLAGFETHIMVIKDLTLKGAVPAPYTSVSEYMKGKEGALVMVNGQVNPVLSIRPGQVQRWQIVNACNARFLNLGLDQHTLNLIGTDGGLVDRPYPVSSLLLAPGERVDLLVRGDRAGGSFRLLSLPYDRGCGTLQQVTLLTLNYGGPGTNDAIPSVINAAASRVSPPPDAVRTRMTLSMGMGKGFINGQSFADMEHCYRIMSETGSWEIWEIVNQSNMDHPFHQHVNSCQVLAITGGDRGYAALYTGIPAWKDVVIVPKMGAATILVPVMDYDGMAMFHCHIIEHEDIGMMGAWHIMPGM